MANEKGQVYVRIRSKTTGEWLVHPELRGKLIETAEAKETNITDVVNEILSQAVGVAYSPARRKSKPRPDEDKLVLKMSPELVTALQIRYPGSKWQNGVRYLLCAHYGLRVPGKVPQKRGSRRPRPAVA